MGIKLSKLNEKLNLKTKVDIIINAMYDDSRLVKKSDIFVCTIKDKKGLTYIKEALEKGAIVYGMFEYEHNYYYQYDNVEMIYQLLKSFYSFNCDEIIIIGICGTNGKTSTATMIYENVKTEAMLISTHHIYYQNQHVKIRNTTPSAFVIAHYLQIAIQKGLKYLIMEVSSHAISENRIFMLKFDYLLYTNITSDHLDYHLCRTHYILTKLKLRKYVKEKGIIICYSHIPYIELLLERRCQVISYPCLLSSSKEGICFRWEQNDYQIPYPSHFQMENATLVICLLQHLKCQNIKVKMQNLPSIQGRNEMIRYHGIDIMIDYAHSEDGLYQLLKNIKEYGYQRVISVLGCGGNRDKGKRSVMGEIACKYSDLAIYTSDNPRNESLFQIIKMMSEHSYRNYEIIENRYYAIKYAVEFAKKGDIIIIAGKGDERTQEINGKFYHFHDKECIKKIIEGESLWNGN